MTRQGTLLKVYVNVTLIASGNILRTYQYNAVTLLIPPDRMNDQAISIDEYTLFNTALDQETIRDWMCKKMTRKHPYACNNLLYFPFNEGQGVLLEDKYGAADMEINLGYFHFVASGAVMGDESVHNYTTPSSISMKHPNGDVLSALRTSGSNYGVHLYRVDNQVPVSSSLGIPGILAMDSIRYWGMYVANTPTTTANYNLNYSYTGHAFVLDENALRMVYRKDNSDQLWKSVTQSLNTTTDVITISGQTRGEYLLAGTSPGTFFFNKPPAPVFKTPFGLINQRTICGNAFQLSYHLVPNAEAVAYN